MHYQRCGNPLINRGGRGAGWGGALLYTVTS